MNNRVRQVILYATLITIMTAMVFMIRQKERTMATGQVMLLELAPRDPRSLMQGDYMVLRYKLVQALGGPSLKDGNLVVSLDEKNIATFKRLYTPGIPLAAGEHLLHFRVRGKGVRLGAESFFFQEGRAADYNNAKYGELRVSENGDSVLVGLRGQDGEVLGPPQ